MAIATPPTGVSNAELVRWSFDQLNRHDVPALRQLWTDTSVVRFPEVTCTGAGEIAAYFEGVLAAVDGFHLEAVSIAAQGDEVFARWHMTGTHAGRFFGIEPTGRSLAIDGMDHFTLRDGRLVSNFVVYDQLQFARQVGLMPPDGSAPDRAMKAAFNARTKVAQKLQERRSTS
jgi:predicted ester cyclase